MAEQDTPEADPDRWMRLINLLSMDVVLPFFGLMGLVLPALEQGLRSREPGAGGPDLPSDAPHRLQRALRHEIVGARRAYALDGRGPPPADMLRDVASVLGDLTMSRLSWWGRCVFCDDPSKDHVGLNSWRPVLTFCARDPELWSRSGLPRHAREAFVESLRMDEYRTLQAEVDRQPLSDWDLHLYALELYDDTLVEDDFGQVHDGPRLWVRPTVRAHRQYRFWNSALRSMTVAQQQQLWRFGREVAREEDILTRPELLPDPHELEVFP